MAMGSIGRMLLAAAMLCLAGSGQAADPGAFRVLTFGAKPTPALVKAGAIALTTEGANLPELPTELLFITGKPQDLTATRKLLPTSAAGPTLVYEATGPRIAATPAARDGAATLAKGAGEAPLYYLFAHLNSGAGKDAEFNAFYNSTHLPEVLLVPGMLWGERGRLISSTPASFAAPRYMAVYQFRSFDLKATMAEIMRRLQGGITTPFPEGATGPGLMMFYASAAPTGARR